MGGGITKTVTGGEKGKKEPNRKKRILGKSSELVNSGDDPPERWGSPFWWLQ